MGNSAPHKARKRFGQHFLHDQNIIRKLVAAINPLPGQAIVEIGPGQGALTLPLLQQCQRMTAVELDRDLIAGLQQQAKSLGTLQLINRDILQFELSELEDTPPYRLVGNLPYNISTPLMFHLLNSSDQIVDMHFMVQKEVAERIIASTGSKHYGRLSVMMQYHCQCEYLFPVAPGCFSPPPKVDSAIIRLVPHQEYPVKVDDVARLELVVKTAFGQRRKTISNSLKKLLDKSELQALNIDPTLRAETLTLADFALITQHLTP